MEGYEAVKDLVDEIWFLVRLDDDGDELMSGPFYSLAEMRAIYPDITARNNP